VRAVEQGEVESHSFKGRRQFGFQAQTQSITFFFFSLDPFLVSSPFIYFLLFSQVQVEPVAVHTPSQVSKVFGRNSRFTLGIASFLRSNAANVIIFNIDLPQHFSVTAPSSFP
jgi:hypothetical protein